MRQNAKYMFCAPTNGHEVYYPAEGRMVEESGEWLPYRSGYFQRCLKKGLLKLCKVPGQRIRRMREIGDVEEPEPGDARPDLSWARKELKSYCAEREISLHGVDKRSKGAILERIKEALGT